MSVLSKYSGNSGSSSSGSGGFYPSSFSREKANASGGKTVVSYDSVSGKKTGTTIYDKNNRPVYVSGTDKDGNRFATNYKTGAQIRISADGSSVTKTWPSGYSRQSTTSYDGSRLVTVTRPSGSQYFYHNYPLSYGHSQVYYYQPTNYSTFDNPWFWLWMSDSHRHDTVVVHETRTTYSDNGSSSSRNFTYDWKSIFPNLPEKAIHFADYRNPVDWLTDYVINEIISEKSPKKKSWWLTPLFGAKADEKAVYEMGANDRLALGDEIRRILGLMRDHKPVQLTDMVDPATGAIKVKATLLLNDDVETRDETNQDVCKLSGGDIVKLATSSPGADDISVEVVKSDADGKGKEKCMVGHTVRLRANQLQSAENDLVQRVERAMQQLAKEHEAGQLRSMQFVPAATSGVKNEDASPSSSVVR